MQNNEEKAGQSEKWERWDRILFREWLLFLLCFGGGLFGIPFLLNAANSQFNISAFYQRLISGELLPWLAFLIPYGLYIAVRLWLKRDRSAQAQPSKPASAGASGPAA